MGVFWHNIKRSWFFSNNIPVLITFSFTSARAEEVAVIKMYLIHSAITQCTFCPCIVLVNVLECLQNMLFPVITYSLL